MLNDMFCDDLPKQAHRSAAWAPELEAPAAAAVIHEPTVTMSTRAAFDLMNGLFSDTLPQQVSIVTGDGGWEGCSADRQHDCNCWASESRLHNAAWMRQMRLSAGNA